MRALNTALAASLAVAAAAPAAHAMGTYITLDVIAWNADGTAALMSRTASSSATAGRSLHYFIVDATTKSPLLFSFDDTMDPEHAHQQVGQKACEASADALGKALAAKKLAGVVVDRTRCKTDRQVILLTPDAARAGRGQPAGMVGPEQVVAMTAASAAVKAADEVANGSGVTVNAWSEKLAIVLWGENGDSSAPAHASVFAGKQRIIDDLR